MADEGWDCSRRDGQWLCTIDKSGKGQGTVAKKLAIPTPASTKTTKVTPKSTPQPTAKPATSVAGTPTNSYPKQKQPPKTAVAPAPQPIVQQTQTPKPTAARPNRQPAKTSNILANQFSVRQNIIFSKLADKLQPSPWQSCTAPKTTGRRPKVAKTPISISADSSQAQNKAITNFKGKVRVGWSGNKISAQQLSYDSSSKAINAKGKVYYSDQQLALYGDNLSFNLATEQGNIDNGLFVLADTPLRGKAATVHKTRNLSRYEMVSLSSCRPGNEDWVLSADKLQVDQKQGYATVRDAWLKLKGVPILYTPYAHFSIDKRRVSGFLLPHISISSNTGFDLSTPYYWNLAPNYDLTISPRYMVKRGAMLGAKFNYLSHNSEGSVAAEYLPYDLKSGNSRYLASGQNTSKLGNFTSKIEVNYASDVDYFTQLNSVLGIATNRFLKSKIDLRYQYQWLTVAAQIESQQSISRSNNQQDKPYQKLPQFNLNLAHVFSSFPLSLALDNEITYFHRKQRISGQRLNNKLSIAIPIETNSWLIKPKFSLQRTQYFLQNRRDTDKKNIARILPIISLDTRFNTQRYFNNGKIQHTIEPRLFYLYVPRVEQDDIPIFDTSISSSSLNNLFRENRYNGIDRIQDTNQITVAVSNSFMDGESGRQLLNLAVGETFYLQNRHTNLQGGTDNSNTSAVIAQLDANPSRHLAFSSSAQWRPNSGDISRVSGNIRWHAGDNILNLGYRYRLPQDEQTTISQSNISTRLVIYNGWTAVGKWQYSLKHHKTVDSFAGLEKESCCWRVRVIWRNYAKIDDNGADKNEQGFFVQLTLKGLASFGDNADKFFANNISGYFDY